MITATSLEDVLVMIAPNVQDAARILAGQLWSTAAGKVVIVTWLNHYTVLQVLRNAAAARALESFDVVGVDGIGLRSLLGREVVRTSADTVVPYLWETAGAGRVVLIGGSKASVVKAADALADRFNSEGRLEVAGVFDGYEDLTSLEENGFEAVRSLRPSIILVGLGGGKQEIYAAAIRDALVDDSGVVVVTCGGFLDQVSDPTYYPVWAYPLRLNWLVRLWREPRRLIGRYTVSVLEALILAPRIRRLLAKSRGFVAYADSFAVGGLKDSGSRRRI
jgi:exopolysaccharide biosynthesis WecB/TagA/CpsF family protein